MTPDLVISGSWGLYTIEPTTPKATRWVRKHIPSPVKLHGRIVCEGGDRCRDIVAGADRDGLRVEVNGQDMKGFGANRG